MWEAILQALGAAFAAYIGVQWGLSRFQQERLFERRFDWYGRAIQAIEHLRLRCRSVRAALDMDERVRLIHLRSYTALWKGSCCVLQKLNSMRVASRFTACVH
jgi:hypothetical protein